jgi:hypothetical protein
MSTEYSNFSKIFKNAVSGVVSVAKFMDEKVDPFCDAVIQMIEDNCTSGEYFHADEDREAFKLNLLTKIDIFFQGNTLRISKPKLERNTRGVTNFGMFQKLMRKDIAEKHSDELEEGQAGFAKLGRIMGEEWKALSEKEKAKYTALADEANKEKNIVKKEDKPKKASHTCEHEDCGKIVRSEPVNGAYYCADHKKKAAKPIITCSFVNKHGIRCSTSVKEDGCMCAKHNKAEEKKVEKKEKKEEKKEEEKEEKKEEKKEKKPVKQPKEEVEEEEEVDWSAVTFDFVNEAPQSVEDDEEYWDKSTELKALKGHYRHPVCRVVYTKSKTGFKFIGISVNGAIEELSVHKSNFPEEILDWAEACGFEVAKPKHKQANLDESDDE